MLNHFTATTCTRRVILQGSTARRLILPINVSANINDTVDEGAFDFVERLNVMILRRYFSITLMLFYVRRFRLINGNDRARMNIRIGIYFAFLAILNDSSSCAINDRQAMSDYNYAIFRCFRTLSILQVRIIGITQRTISSMRQLITTRELCATGLCECTYTYIAAKFRSICANGLTLRNFNEINHNAFNRFFNICQ